MAHKLHDGTTEKKEPYRLLFGEYNGFDKEGKRHLYRAGEAGNDVVSLTESQANAFSHQFKSVRVLKAEAMIAQQLADDDDAATNTILKEKDDQLKKMEDENKQLLERLKALEAKLPDNSKDNKPDSGNNKIVPPKTS